MQVKCRHSAGAVQQLLQADFSGLLPVSSEMAPKGAAVHVRRGRDRARATSFRRPRAALGCLSLGLITATKPHNIATPSLMRSLSRWTHP